MNRDLTRGQQAFWSKVARRYDQVVDLQIGPKTRSLVRERLAKEDSLGTVVEFGCGTGFYTAVLAAKSQSVTATDLSSSMLAIARESVPAANVSFQAEDCQKCSLPDGSFDTVFMSLLIHFTTPERVMREVSRILRPGGLLLIVNLDLDALRGFDKLRCRVRIVFHGLTRYRTTPPPNFSDHLMTEQQLCHLLQESGLNVVSSETSHAHRISPSNTSGR